MRLTPSAEPENLGDRPPRLTETPKKYARVRTFPSGNAAIDGQSGLDVQPCQRFADDTVALAGFDLSVAPGGFVRVVGPSGCGKSMLLRIASGLTAASEGDARVDTDKIGYVF
jgi:ABC-type multidrug transport system ATPase subunit